MKADRILSQFFTKEGIISPFAQTSISAINNMRGTSAAGPETIAQFLKQEQHSNFADFCLDSALPSCIDAGECEMSTFMNVGLHVDYERVQKERSSFSRSWKAKQWDALTVREKYSYVEGLKRRAFAKGYGLPLSNWKPTDSFADFMVELDKRGPMAITGFFGRAYHKVAPSDMQKQIAGRKVYYWKKSYPTISIRVAVETILLIGAEQSGNTNLVFFHDSLDESDPAHPQNQRILAMTYARLTSRENLVDNTGDMNQDAPPSIGYAFRAANPILSIPKPSSKSRRKMKAR
jgi:hypothetical protein